ncbi:hypothetical protein G114_07022 [Aeromonas diversa CDC 2478-85]|uniref:Uncharacterized protein n=1 Tax=Aeromonas diversa CDC 2478-85 TaxID=1268237 RepID=N9U2S4_9GAMM|nr:hypothetical protein G114_07022 [Aeromonas diversa CDC 2478-85]
MKPALLLLQYLEGGRSLMVGIKLPYQFLYCIDWRRARWWGLVVSAVILCCIIGPILFPLVIVIPISPV